MPFVPRLFVRTGIVYLIATFVAGAVMLILEALGHPLSYVIEIEHGHAGFVGWLVNTVIGIGLWLLPLNRRRFPSSQGRYPEAASRIAFGLLNGGLLLRLFCEPWFVSTHLPAASVLLIVGAVAQVAAIAVVGWIMWQRVYAPPLRPNV